MNDIFEAIALCIGIIFAAPILLIAWTLLFTDRAEYFESQKRTGTFLDRLKGRMTPGCDGARDPRVHAGLIFNNATKKYETQYALSDEAVKAVLFARKY